MTGLNVQLYFNTIEEKERVRKLINELKEVVSAKTGGELVHRSLIAYKDTLGKRLGISWKS